jgi:hypothetical protein
VALTLTLTLTKFRVIVTVSRKLEKRNGNRSGEPRRVQQLRVQGREWSVNSEDRGQIRTEESE